MPDPFAFASLRALLFHMKISVAAATKCGHGMTRSEGDWTRLGCRNTQILIMTGTWVRLPVVILYAANAVDLGGRMP